MNERQDEPEERQDLDEKGSGDDGGEAAGHVESLGTSEDAGVGPKVPISTTQTDYDGPERRQDRLDLFDRLGVWIGKHMGALAAVIVVQTLLLGFIAVGVGVLANRSSDEVHALGKQVDQLEVTAADAKLVADFVRDCIITESSKRDPAKCGSQAGEGGSQLVSALVKYWNCSLLIRPEERTAKLLDACATGAFGR